MHPGAVASSQASSENIPTCLSLPRLTLAFQGSATLLTP